MFNISLYFHRSNIALSKMYTLTKGQIPLIGVGGISTADDVYTKLKLGEKLLHFLILLLFFLYLFIHIFFENHHPYICLFIYQHIYE
jgi:hypothetical protein